MIDDLLLIIVGKKVVWFGGCGYNSAVVAFCDGLVGGWVGI
jgi:hypothetical protein